MAASTTTFKLFFMDDIRRLSFQSAPNFEEFTKQLVELIPNYHPELYLRWKDEDGDSIIVSSQMEWEHMLVSLKDEKPIKLWITEGLAPYFKDGPPAQPTQFYQEGATPLPVEEKPEFMQRLRNAVPKSLQKLFPSNRIIPDHIPSWLQEALTIKRLPNQEVDLDVDIQKLFAAMHKRSLECLKDARDAKLIQQGKQLLLDMLEIIPRDAVTLYNLSCAESLLGNIKEALHWLKQSILEGYKNFEHMMKDQDLENLRKSPEFKQLLETFHLTSKPEENNSIPTPVQQTPTPAAVDVVNNTPAPVIPEEPKSQPAVPEETPQSQPMEEDWTHVGEQLKEPIPEPEPVSEPEPIPEPEPVLSAGEVKWKESIELLKNMGFGGVYFGPKCVVLLEKHNGDLPSVINDLLRDSF